MLQKKLLFASVLAMFSTAAILGGCGSASKESGSQSGAVSTTAATIDNPAVALDTTKVVDAATLAGTINGVPVTVENTTSCLICHGSTGVVKAVAKTVGSTAFPSGWALGPHATQGSINTTNALCVACHDPFGDGAKLTAAAAGGSQVPAGISATVVGCEACHGGGSMHRGIGALPAAKPGVKRCGSCHGKQWASDAQLAGHKTSFPEGDGIYDDFITSPHSKSINSSTLVSGSTTDVTALCARCHTDEGVKAYLPTASGTLDFTDLGTAMTGKANIAAASAVQCRTCHDPHNGKPLGSKDVALAVTPWSDEFKTCTSCHQLIKPFANATTANAANKVVAYHDTAASQTITDTHLSVRPATGSSTPGYGIDPRNTRACSNCHNPHNADNTLNNQYAASAHFTNGVSWVEEGNVTNANCQRCHTTTGFAGYIAQVAANNNGGVSVTNPARALKDKEMLYCNGCHTNSKGGLVDPKVWQYTNGNAATYVIPPGRLPASEVTFINSLGGTLLCANCHMGRTTGQSVKNNTYTTTATAASAANGDHYYGTFGWMFRTLAYEFTGADYDTNGRSTHATIGTSGSAAPGNGNGPCVGCHMYPDPGKTKANHQFTVMTRNATTNQVTGVLAYTAVCVKCHTAGELERITDINTIESQYYSAIQAYRVVFAANKGVYYKLTSNAGTRNGSALSGTFKKGFANSTTAVFPLTAADAGNRTIGAGFNLRTMDYRLKGKSMFHNYLYTKRLIYDAIDFLDDGALNNSVDATIAALTETTAYTNETATEFQITAADKAAARLFLGATRP